MHLPVVNLLPIRHRRQVFHSGKISQHALFASSTVSAASATTATVTVPDSVPAPPTKPVNEVLAGATARVASQATIHPLDTLKVRIQTGRKTVGFVKGVGKPLPFLSRAAKDILTLYKGVLGSAAGAGFAIGIYFVFYSTTRNVMMRKMKMNPGTAAFVSAGAAAVSVSVVKVPLAVCVRSIQAGLYKNAFDAATSIVKAAGIRGLFTGYLPTVIEDVPDLAVKFAAYETMRSVHKSVVTDRQPSVQEDFAMGAVSGALAAAFTTPIDVVKTNMMCQASSRPTAMAVAGKIMSARGLRGFFHGVGPRALSDGINSAIFFCFFEAFRSIIVKKQAQFSSTKREVGALTTNDSVVTTDEVNHSY